MSQTEQFLSEFESIEVIGQGSFGKIRKVRRKRDGLVSYLFYVSIHIYIKNNL